ncbi:MULTISPECIES: cyanobactin biosynthesis PatC/TenC/TruC family protein [unclassified Streptomyces]|uniref:cyanobactin biosynthesis PatC/TenC/TruC family protein n=1 Tax=unclassified Streptomyces TaxID=2593676 RepID=UPI0023660582|nr:MULTISPECIES: cyanobactin biosynthesis PatC/TenC/TruC family protein [unclassified Streptomyces]MDF3149587.1 cyanobactin biosynthesis PatC/TenC/TruC family protein [Streptomyces sp. T21Q-yed]WDF42104.1 cyanobactin biosynthesis PatC/TenC/TruC family protein [Streptomyces sp. T12]
MAKKPATAKTAAKKTAAKKTAVKTSTAKRAESKPAPEWNPVIPECGLFTGLVDYGMWVQMFQDRPEEPSTGFRRGRIWV